MSEQVILALIIAVPAALVPTVALMLNNRQVRSVKETDAAIRKQEKEADYKRADELEARRKTDADEVARILKANTAAQVESFGELKGQVQQVHTLVNSNLTEEMEARLVEMQVSLMLREENASLRKVQGHPSNETADERIKELHERINALLTTLKTRHAVTDAAAVEKRVTQTATKAATAALTAAGPLAVTIQQAETDPVPVKPVETDDVGKPP